MIKGRRERIKTPTAGRRVCCFFLAILLAADGAKKAWTTTSRRNSTLVGRQRGLDRALSTVQPGFHTGFYQWMSRGAAVG